MDRFEELTQENQNEVVCRAWEWRQEHSNHVDHLVKNQNAWYPPTGSDLHNPNRWKAAHWKWFDRGGE